MTFLGKNQVKAFILIFQLWSSAFVILKKKLPADLEHTCICLSFPNLVAIKDLPLLTVRSFLISLEYNNKTLETADRYWITFLLNTLISIFNSFLTMVHN